MTNIYFGTIALTLLYSLSILGWGGLLSRLLRSPGTFWQEFTARVVLGCSSLYGLFILLSSVGRLHRLEAIIVVSVGVLLACAEIPDLARRASAAFNDVMTWPRGEHVIGVVVISAVLLQVVFGFTPLIFYDLQAYHLLAPSQFLMSGSLSHIPWNVMTNTPLAMQLTLGMSLAVDPSGQVVKLLLTLIGCLAAVGVYEFIRPVGLRPALLATLFALSFPEFLLMQTLGAVDLPIAALTIFGAIWARDAFATKSWQSAVLAGLAFGLAIGSRYQAIVHVSWIIAVLGIENRLSKQPVSFASLIRPMIIMGALVGLLLAPWAIRNYVHLGNPVFPLMQSVWSSTTTEWSADQMAKWNSVTFGPSFGALTRMQQALAPIGLLLIQPANGLFGTALILGAIIGISVSRTQVRLASFLGLSGLLIWGFLRPSAGSALLRFNALSILFLLAATGAILGSEWFPARAARLSGLALSAGSIIIAIIHVQSGLPAAQSLIDAGTHAALRVTSVPSWEAFEYVNEKLDRQHDKILLIGETRAFWLHVPYIAPSPINGPQLDRIFGGNTGPGDWAQEFSQLGVTHLLVSKSEVERWHKQYRYLDLTDEQAEKLNRWIEALPKVFDDNRGNIVLELGPRSKLSAY